MKDKDIFISSYSDKRKYSNLSQLHPWKKLLEDYGCLSVSSIRDSYKKLVENFTADNLVVLLDNIEMHFKDTKQSQIKTIHEYISKTDYKKITVDYEDDGGDKYVDYYLMDL